MEIINESSSDPKSIKIKIGSSQKFTLTPEQLSVRYPNLYQYWIDHNRPKTLPLDPAKAPDCFAHYLETGQIPYDYTISRADYGHLKLPEDFIAKIADELRSTTPVTTGKSLFCATSYNSILRLDLTSGKWLQKFKFYFTIRDFIVHNNMLYVGDNCVITKRDILNGKKQWISDKHHSGYVYAVIVHNDKLYSGSEDGTICQWDLDTGECLRTFKGSYVITSIIAYDDKLYSGSYDGTICEWNINTGECLRAFHTQVEVVRIDIHNGILYSYHIDGCLFRWDLVEGIRKPALKGGIKAFDFYNDKLYSVSDNDICQWDPDTGECLRTLNVKINASHITIHDNKLYSRYGCGNFVQLQELDLETGKCLRTFGGKIPGKVVGPILIC